MVAVTRQVLLMRVPAFGELLLRLLRFHIGRFHGLVTLHRLRVVITKMENHSRMCWRRVPVESMILKCMFRIIQTEMMGCFFIWILL